MTRHHPLPGPAADRYRMRRLTDDEMAGLVKLARDGRKGPGRMLDALWDLILQDAEGVTVAEAAARPGSYHVQNYAMPADQAAELHDAMVLRRRLPERVVAGFYMLWAMHSPADLEPDIGHTAWEDVKARRSTREDNPLDSSGPSSADKLPGGGTDKMRGSGSPEKQK